MAGTSNEGFAFALFNHLSDSVIVTEVGFEPPGPKIIYVNDAFVDACGLPRAELLGQPLSSVHPAFQSRDRLHTLERCCRERRTYKNDGVFATRSGVGTPVAWHIAPVFLDDELKYLLCVLSTDSESAESIKALRDSERRYRSLFENGLVAKMVLTPEGHFLVVNQSYCDLVGYTKEELIGAHFSMVVAEDELDKVLEFLRSIFEEGSPGYQTERRYRHKDGHDVTVLVDVLPERDEHGNVVALVGQAQDISDLKVTEAALHESEIQLKAILDHSPAEIYLKDAEGRYVKVNRQFERLFNIRNEDLRGKLPWDATYKELADRSRAHDLEVLKTGRNLAREEEVYFQTPDDDSLHILHTVKFPILQDDKVVGLGAIATDITDIKQTEMALRESEGRLRDFAEIAADWFWETDENLVITYISDVHRQITGIPDEQILGRTREELFRKNIYKAFNPAIHLRTLKNYWDSMVEYSVTRDDGREVIVHDRASPFFDYEGNFKGYRGVGRDITEQRRLTERIAYQASRDSLTGTVNRREFEHHLDEAVEDARSNGAEHVLAYVDLDKFKLLNDTLGHAAGDYLLKMVVRGIQAKISSEDLLGRIGGDEFGILLRNTDIRRAKKIALTITRSIKAQSFKWEDRNFSIAMSVGLAPLNGQTKSSSELLARADSACYRAKERGGVGVWVSDENEAARLRTYTEILRSITGGSAEHLSSNFQLVGQPICPLASPGDHLAWYEVLLRVVGSDGRFYRPSEFIRLAEQHGKMPVIDQWVLETAIASHARLVARIPDAVMSINLSSTSLNTDDGQEAVDRLVERHGLRPENLCFEIAERSAMVDLKRTAALVKLLSRQGYRVALDEFGSGPSSFACLKRLPVHYLKLYGELARQLRRDEIDIAIVESTNELSKRLNMTAIAVQVETKRAANALRKIGLELGQGDALGETRPLEELIEDLPSPFKN
ncbi:MAG: PAS domain S-box protein [Arenicellales bacterium]